MNFTPFIYSVKIPLNLSYEPVFPDAVDSLIYSSSLYSVKQLSHF